MHSVNWGASIKSPISAGSEVLGGSVAGSEETNRPREKGVLSFRSPVRSRSGQIGVAARQFELVGIASRCKHRTDDHETAGNDDLARQAGSITANKKKNGPRNRLSIYIA
jgi:hypothetical protein